MPEVDADRDIIVFGVGKLWDGKFVDVVEFPSLEQARRYRDFVTERGHGFHQIWEKTVHISFVE